MANCGFKIIKNGSNFVVGINHDQSSFSDTTYTLSVNGSAAFYGNPRIFGVQYPGFLYYTRATNTQAVGEQFIVCAASGNYYSPRQHGFRTYTYNSSTGAANSSYHESYYLPAVDADRTNSSEFSILTSKNAVTIAQGGTNATTAANARTQLGITPANIGAKATQTAVSDPAYDGNSLTFIDTISQNAQGVITPHKAVVRSASATQNGIVTIGEQTFAGIKTFDAITTPDVTLSGGYLYFKETGKNTISGRFTIMNTATVSSDHRIYVLEYSYNSNGTRTDHYDSYTFPEVATGKTQNDSYEIWTTKNYYATSSTALTYTTNSHCDAANLGHVRCDRSGRIAVLSTTTALYLKAYSSSSWIQIGTVPAGYRPVAMTTVRIPLSSGDYMVRINTSGSVQIYKTTNETSNAYFSIPWRIA